MRNHGSIPRRTKASTCSNESLARHFFTTHGDHRWTCRIVAHCMSRTRHIRKTQNRSFVIQQEGDKRTQDCVFDCCKRYVLFCPLLIPSAYLCNPMCFSSDSEEKQCGTPHGDRFKGTNGLAEMTPSHVTYVTLASGTFER